jgi:hypothetical protein
MLAGSAATLSQTLPSATTARRWYSRWDTNRKRVAPATNRARVSSEEEAWRSSSEKSQSNCSSSREG